ncbi:Transposable element P transposase [Armadillidium vulgare]|nr:Transposable element P transposase [Armadillidium vulgare]
MNFLKKCLDEKVAPRTMYPRNLKFSISNPFPDILKEILKHKINCNSNLQYQKEQRIDNLQESSTSGSNSKEEQVLQFCYKKLSEPAFEILKLQLMKNCRKYSSKVRILCLTLYYTSPLLYNVLREIFKLPSVSSLRLWTRKLNIQVGVCPRLFSVLSAKMLKVHEVDKICVLYIDEMSIKKSLEYNSRFGSILGFVDYGNGRREPKLANTALAFMVRSLHSNWKQALSFFFCENSVPFLELKEVMFSILTELKNIGIKVVAITTDQGSNFAKCFKNLGVSISEPFFNFQNEKIYVLCDVPHLIKSVRNTLKNYNIRSNDGTAKWDDIRKCYELNLSNNFKFIPKVTEKHINVPPFGGKMKVKLATQVLSASMATAIHTATIINIPNKLGSDAVATAKFCNKMNNLFDVLNSSCVISSSPYKRALTTDGISWKYLAEMCNWISSWVIVDVNEKNITNRIKCKSGLVTNNKCNYWAF